MSRRRQGAALWLCLCVCVILCSAEQPPKRPRIYVYDLPLNLTEPRYVRLYVVASEPFAGRAELTGLASATCFLSAACAPPRAAKRPQHFGASVLLDRLKRSPYYEADHTKADLFWIPHKAKGAARLRKWGGAGALPACADASRFRAPLFHRCLSSVTRGRRRRTASYGRGGRT